MKGCSGFSEDVSVQARETPMSCGAGERACCPRRTQSSWENPKACRDPEVRRLSHSLLPVVR